LEPLAIQDIPRPVDALEAAKKREMDLKKLEEMQAARIKEQERQEELERKRKDAEELEQKKRFTRRLFLQDLVDHCTSFKDYHSRILAQNKKISVQVLQYINNAEKRRKLQEDKDRKLRMKALKANDMDAYMKLVQNHKSDRLSQLIQQSEEFLKQIGEKVENENVLSSFVELC
jgi:hypothetical protein